MANTAANVVVGKPLATGGLLTGPLGTTLPTDTATALNVAILPCGYVGSDGVVQTIDADQTQIKAWGGDIVRSIQTSHDLTYKFTLIETNNVSLKAYYGEDNVTDGAVQIKAGDLEHKVWVIEIKDGDSRIRICIPDGQVTDRGDVSFTDEDAVGGEITLECFPDADGVKAYLYTLPAGGAS